MIKYFIYSLIVLLSFFPEGKTQNSEKWIISTAQGTGLYAQSWATRLEFPKDFIQDHWSQGKQITNLHFSKGLWAIVLSEGSTYESQTWVTRRKFDQELIQEKWEEGYSLTETAYGQGAWAFVFSKRKIDVPQIYQLSGDFPEQFIKSQWEKGYYINTVSYGSGKWLVCMEQSPAAEQSYIVSRDYPEGWIREKLEADFEMEELTFGNGYWLVVAAKKDTYANVLYANDQFPKSEISLAWAQEASITQLAFGYAPRAPATMAPPPATPLLGSSSENQSPDQLDPNQPTFHLVCAMDTRDRMLGAGARTALQVVSDQFSAAAKSINYQVRPLVVQQDQFNRNNLQEAIQNLQVGEEDIIVFYYFGHGFRYNNDASRYPTCFVGKNGIDEPEVAAWPLLEIYQQLTQKQARLTLVFAECCNNEIGIPAPIDNYVATRQMSVNFASKDRYKALFLQNRGSILLASSDQGQVSWATSTGGYFLDGFMDAIQYQVSSGNTAPVSWKSLLEDTEKRVRRMAAEKKRLQEPIYSIKIE
ncbi:MAG TPA: caspase family protein [Saprospiraceae bacterium]|nr:caspase family protein [Saprospiraceae bacterium]